MKNLKHITNVAWDIPYRVSNEVRVVFDATSSIPKFHLQNIIVSRYLAGMSKGHSKWQWNYQLFHSAN